MSLEVDSVEHTHDECADLITASVLAFKSPEVVVCDCRVWNGPDAHGLDAIFAEITLQEPDGDEWDLDVLTALREVVQQSANESVCTVRVYMRLVSQDRELCPQ